MDIIQEVQTIQYIVNNSKSVEQAKKIYSNLDVFLLSKKQADQIFEDSLKKKFNKESNNKDSIEKAKAFPVGTIRVWSGQKYVKHTDGWVVVGGQHHGKLMGKFKEEPTHVDHADKYKDVTAPAEGEMKVPSEPEKHQAVSQGKQTESKEENTPTKEVPKKNTISHKQEGKTSSNPLGPRPSPENISFDSKNFVVIGKKKIYSVVNELGVGYPRHYNTLQEAEQDAQKTNQDIRENEINETIRISWNKDAGYPVMSKKDIDHEKKKFEAEQSNKKENNEPLKEQKDKNKKLAEQSKQVDSGIEKSEEKEEIKKAVKQLKTLKKSKKK